jgi:hypothetical protein
VNWGRLRWEWGTLRARVKENKRRGWRNFFGKKPKQRKREREQDERDAAALGFLKKSLTSEGVGCG